MNRPDTAIPGLVSRRAAEHGNETILRHKNRGIWKALNWAQLAERVNEIGSALLAADFGRGDVVAILSETRPEAAYADLAILGCGAASVAIDPDDDPDSVCHKLLSSGSRLAFVEDEEQLDKVLAIRDRCPALSRIVLFDMKGLRDFDDASCIALSRFIETGGAADWAAAVRTIAADQPAIIHFSRESLGVGRTLTHGDLLHMVSAAHARLDIRPNDERLAVLRPSDITERVWGLYLALEARCISNYPEGPDTVIENLQELQPTVLGSDAAVWDHLYTLATARANNATPIQRLAYESALRAGRRGGPAARLAELIVLHAVRREFGLNRLRLAYVGGRPVGPAGEWARSLGIAIRRVDEPVVDAGQAEARYQALMQNANV